MTRRGYVAVIAITAAMFLLPLLTELGHPGLWMLLPFLLATLASLAYALDRNTKDRAITETLTLAATELTLTRKGPRAEIKNWQANPHWVRLTLHATAGPVPNYLTLTGNGREVELGAFLTEPERIALKAELETRLSGFREAGRSLTGV